MDNSTPSPRKECAPANTTSSDTVFEVSHKLEDGQPGSSSSNKLLSEPRMSGVGAELLAGLDDDETKKRYQQLTAAAAAPVNHDSHIPKPLTPKQTSTSSSKMSNRAGLDFSPGLKLEAKDFNEKWYTARVVETDWSEREVLIHFEKWNSRYDEWIPMDSSRLRPLQASPKDSKSKEFVLGERVLATWADGKKYPATVKVTLGNDKYEVLFYDGYSKVLRSSKMTKIVDGSSGIRPEHQYQQQQYYLQQQMLLQQQQQSAYLGTKQERRDKKRKHVVMELFHSKKKNKNDGDKSFKKQDSNIYNTIKSIPKVECIEGLPKTETLAPVEVYHNLESGGNPEEDYATYIGDLRVEIEDSMYKCPIAGCNKNVRKENLLQMHIKHYHPEYSKFLGSTPNVADLAYARTIGESVEDLIPKKIRVIPAHSTQGAHMSPSVSHATDTDSSQAEVDKHLDGKLYSENNASLTEDNSSEQSNSCTMSPGTLFDMRFKEERTHTGIKTLPPVRHLALGTDDSEHSQYSVSNDIHKATTPIDIKAKPQRKRQHSESANRNRKQKSISEHEESYNHFDDTILDGEDAVDSSFKYNNISNSRSEMDNTDSVHSQIDNVMLIDGELVKVEKLRREEIINCTCGITEEDGLMIQCDLCLCWQHGLCNGIEKEKDVPEKYVCYICQYSYRQRPSKKYFHDQDWIREGKLPSMRTYPSDVLKQNQRTAMLKRTYDLVAGLLQTKDLLYSLRVKVNISKLKDHPKLYLWAKNWSKITIPDFKTDPIPVMEVVKVESSADNNEGNTQEKLDFSFSIKNEPDQKLITSDTELMNILEDSTQTDESKSTSKQTTSTTNNSIKNDGKILLDALTKNGFEEEQQMITIKKEVDKDESPSKTNSTSQQNNVDKCNKSSTVTFQAEDKLANVAQQPVIPEPEAPIDPVECKLRLLEHIDHFQNYVESTLTFVESQLAALEDVNSNGKQIDLKDVKIKQTMQMIHRDLESMRKLAALCS